jgi:hypothetical protein
VPRRSVQLIARNVDGARRIPSHNLTGYDMPRYYVHLEPHGLKDDEGEELPGPAAAKALAKQVADDLIRNRDEELPYQRILVTDVTGAVIYEAPLVLH